MLTHMQRSLSFPQEEAKVIGYLRMNATQYNELDPIVSGNNIFLIKRLVIMFEKQILRKSVRTSFTLGMRIS